MATIWRDPVTEVWHSTFLRSNCTSEPEILQETWEGVEHKELLLVVGLLTTGAWDRYEECTVVDVTKAAIVRKPTKFNPCCRLTTSRGGTTRAYSRVCQNLCRTTSVHPSFTTLILHLQVEPTSWVWSSRSSMIHFENLLRTHQT